MSESIRFQQLKVWFGILHIGFRSRNGNDPIVNARIHFLRFETHSSFQIGRNIHLCQRISREIHGYPITLFSDGQLSTFGFENNGFIRFFQSQFVDNVPTGKRGMPTQRHFTVGCKVTYPKLLSIGNDKSRFGKIHFHGQLLHLF